MTLRKTIREIAETWRVAGIPNAEQEARQLVAHLLVKEEAWVVAHGDEECTLDLRDYIARRAKGEPLAYILGMKEFAGRSFIVNSHVLIPREETELVVAEVLSRVPSGKVLEVGTGSGVIACTLALGNPAYEITATDISASALVVAQENAERLGAHIHFLQSDLLAKVSGEFAVVVANLPYIPDAEDLPASVSEYEPHLALFGGADGLDLYRRLIRERQGRTPLVICEIGEGQGEILQAEYSHVEIKKDLMGFDRVAIFHIE